MECKLYIYFTIYSGHGTIEYMKNKVQGLTPTIWRTVRAAMNAKRLNLLRAVLFSNGREFTVSDLARKFGIDQPIATNYLRQLNARGLLGVTRGRIKVFYNSEQDRSLPDSVEIQETLKACMVADSAPGWEGKLMTVMKAFSHFNRLAMITRLAEGPATIDDLRQAIGGCVKSIYHHLEFLSAAGLISVDQAFHRPSVFQLVPPAHPLARTLLKITLQRQSRFRKYWNAPIGDDNDPATRYVLRKIDRAEAAKRELRGVASKSTERKIKTRP